MVANLARFIVSESRMVAKKNWGFFCFASMCRARGLFGLFGKIDESPCFGTRLIGQDGSNGAKNNGLFRSCES